MIKTYKAGTSTTSTDTVATPTTAHKRTMADMGLKWVGDDRHGWTIVKIKMEVK